VRNGSGVTGAWVSGTARTDELSVTDTGSVEDADGVTGYRQD
jgi:hypothetical protein